MCKNQLHLLQQVKCNSVGRCHSQLLTCISSHDSQVSNNLKSYRFCVWLKLQILHLEMKGCQQAVIIYLFIFKEMRQFVEDLKM